MAGELYNAPWRKLGRLLLVIGSILFLHAAYSTYERMLDLPRLATPAQYYDQ